MDDIDSSFREQQMLEDYVNLKAMAIQLCINVFFTVCVLMLFSWLRPRHAFIYAPKAKLCKSDVRRPATLGPGWLDWVKPVFKIKDEALLQNVGFDGYVFVYFARMLRQLIVVMIIMSFCVFLPVNILAVYNTGDWPPTPGLDFMSISAMNYQYGKQSKKPNALWYWSPTVATWFFSLVVVLQLIRSSEVFMQFRQKYYVQRKIALKTRLPSLSSTELLQYRKDELIERTLLVHFNDNCMLDVPPHSRRSNSNNIVFTSNVEMKQRIDALSSFPCQQVLCGKYNARIYFLVNNYNRTIQLLEKVLNRYMSRIKQEQYKCDNLDSDQLAKAVSKLKRPKVRLNWGCKIVDAINYYTERALSLESAIKRSQSKLQNCNYGWVIYSDASTAQKALVSIQQEMKERQHENGADVNKQLVRLRVAPLPQDIIWANMNIEHHTNQLKRWFGYGLFFSILFVWSIPIALLAVCSNVINFVRLFNEADRIIRDNQLMMGLMESYLTPLCMVLFQVGLPELLGIVSRQQAYKTETTVERKILGKLYMFFAINNLVIFTLVNIMLGIVGQITALTLAGTLEGKPFSDYIVQIAKNMSDVSSFWINYVCLRSVGIVFDLLQVAPLVLIVILPNHYAGGLRYTPRQLDSVIGSPPPFSYAKNYGLIVSFFTAALVYSVTAPIVLPFALVYFGLATPIFKYKLLYIYVTKTETHGRIWQLLYRIVMLSVIVFQAMMILILSLKAGLDQAYSLLPLPFITLAVGLVYVKRLETNDKLKTWIGSSNNNSSSNHNLDEPSLARTLRREEEEAELNGTAFQNTTITGIEQDEAIARDAHLLSTIYLDPCLHEPLWKPMLYDDIKHIVPLVYKDHCQQERIIATLFNNSYVDNNSNRSKASADAIQHQQLTRDTTAAASGCVSLSENIALTETLYEKKLYMQNLENHPPPSMNPHAIPYYYQESEDFGASSSTNGLGCFGTVSHSPLQEEINSAFIPSAPTLEEMLKRNNSVDSIAIRDDASSSSLAFISVPPPPKYADVVLPRMNAIQTVTRQTQYRRHST